MELPHPNILIYRLGSLGDTVVALPAFHKIRDVYPNADISLLTNQPVNANAAPLQSILGSDYFFNRTISYPIGTRNPLLLLKLIRAIRKLNIDTLIYLVSVRRSKTMRATKLGLLRDKLFFKASGVKKIIGIPGDIEDIDIVIDDATGRFEWEAKRLTRRIARLGPVALNDDHFWDLRFTSDELHTANLSIASFDKEKPMIAVSTGTKQQSKDWEEDNWIALLSVLKQRLVGWQLILIGSNEEAQRADKCLAAWGGPGINLCGKTSPRVSGAIMQQAKLFVGHDSGPMHLAACAGTPCVAIFSAMNLPGQWYPRGNSNKIIYHKTDCAGCGLEICIVQQKKCILSITVHEVQHAIMEIIADQLPR